MRLCIWIRARPIPVAVRGVCLWGLATCKSTHLADLILTRIGSRWNTKVLVWSTCSWSTVSREWSLFWGRNPDQTGGRLTAGHKKPTRGIPRHRPRFAFSFWNRNAPRPLSIPGEPIRHSPFFAIFVRAQNGRSLVVVSVRASSIRARPSPILLAATSFHPRPIAQCVGICQ